MLTELSQAVLECQKSGSGVDQVVNRIARIVYWYPPMRRKWNEDECSEFLCHFHKRIPGMIQRYRYKGSPFEALLKVSLQYQMKSFALEQKKKRISEKVLANEHFWGANWENPGLTGAGEVREAPPGTAFPAAPPGEISGTIREKLGIGPRGRIIDESTGRRLLLLILREAGRMSDERLKELFSLLNYESAWLAEKLQEVQLLNIRLEERRNKCRQRRNQALFNIYCLQEELEETPETADRDTLIHKAEKERRNQKTAELALARLPKSPTHRQLAEILGIPKGTVDSGLYFINRLLSEKPEENDPPGEESG